MTCDWITTSDIVEIQTAATLQLMDNLHDFRVFHDLSYFNIIVDCLHNWVILHFLLLLGLLFLCFLLLLIGQIVEVVPA